MKRLGMQATGIDLGVRRNDLGVALPAASEPAERDVLPVETGDAALMPSRALVEEGRFFSRYLLGGQEATGEALERYAEASRVLFHGAPAPEDLGVLRFIERRRWALPYLDAAAGLIDRDSLLRRKLLLTFAILETTPAHVSAFTPVPGSRLAVVLRLIAAVMSSAFKALLGLLIYPFAKRAR